MTSEPTRYELVSRRALLKATAGLGAALVLPTACGNGDAEVFAGAVTDPVSRGAETAGQVGSAAAEQTPVPTTPPVTVEPAVDPTPSAESLPTPEPSATPEATATTEPTATAVPVVAVAGEMVISFTYTQVGAGKNERPYIAVWIENEAGELAETVSLWYQQERRGERWLDHLDRWWERDQSRIIGGGVDDSVTISSATREPGAYAVAWDGTIDGVPAQPGTYFLCIEAAREEGPYSLIREPLTLTGSLAATALPDNGELSAATVRIDV